MTKRKRSLELAGTFDNIIPVDNTRVVSTVVPYNKGNAFFKPNDKYLYDGVFTDEDAIPYKLIERGNFQFDKQYLTQKEIEDFVNKKAAEKNKSSFRRAHYKTGGIHIDPSKRGTFTAAATKHGMSVQGFASKVLANKEDYSPAMVKKANFAKNASKWH
jgi:hypothetical protein